MIRIHNLKSALLALAVPIALASCSFDGDYDDCPDTAGVKTVRLQITANDPAAVNDTRFSPPAEDIEKQEPGTDGEYINSLDIFIVGSGDDVVAYAAHLDDNNLDAAAPGGDAANGNLRSYTSDAIPLTEGTQYTVYAFANMSTTYSSAWADIASIEENGMLPKATLDSIVLDDPAAKLDLSTNFIPMSSEPVTTDLSTPVIDVSLDRLVSKIRLAVSKDNGVDVTSLKISGWADKVSLMDNADASASPSGTVFDCGKVFTSDELTKIDAGTYDFYVNETPTSNPFSVEVKTNEQGDPVYAAMTTRDNLPRNCIYPLTLNLNTLTLQLTAGFWFNVIGERVPLEVTNSDNVFVVNIPDGMEFYLDAEMQGDTDGNTFTYNWAVEGGVKDAFTLMQEDANGGYSNVTAINDNPHVAGMVAALGLSEGEYGGQYTLDLGVTWGASSRSYKVKINHVYFDEAYWYEQIMAVANAATTTASHLQPETLNMVINH